MIEKRGDELFNRFFKSLEGEPLAERERERVERMHLEDEKVKERTDTSS